MKIPKNGAFTFEGNKKEPYLDKKGSFLFYVALIKKKSHVIKNATTKGIIFKKINRFLFK